MSTHLCCACHSATLLNRQAIHRMAFAAGLLDNVLRQYNAYIRDKPPQDQPWANLSALLEWLPTTLDDQLEGIHQGQALAQSIDKNWLGCFDSLCLTCGLMHLPIESE